MPIVQHNFNSLLWGEGEWIKKKKKTAERQRRHDRMTKKMLLLCICIIVGIWVDFSIGLEKLNGKIETEAAAMANWMWLCVTICGSYSPSTLIQFECSVGADFAAAAVAALYSEHQMSDHAQILAMTCKYINELGDIRTQEMDVAKILSELLSPDRYHYEAQELFIVSVINRWHLSI